MCVESMCMCIYTVYEEEVYGSEEEDMSAP